MSERTTIGGTVYETVGSSSSNLLLKCNGTARIQWGNKLIDLIKNGRIAAGDDSNKISTISNESEIKSDGIYILDAKNSTQLLICKDGKHYNLTGTDLYISANKKQDITAEQQKQALENIGMYYNTLDEVKSAGVQNGLVYILEDQNLYTIKEGIISEFEAKLKTVTVEQEKEQGEIINSSLQIVLSVLNEDYIILSNRRITVNYELRIKDTAQIGSENADSANGYRLYMDKGVSYLDVDQINARNWSPFTRGMIMMYSGTEQIPEGWAICDGKEYIYKGISSTTPNLVNRFIKAVASIEEIGPVDNLDLNGDNEFILQAEHLPEHSHPHKEHTHTISDSSVVVEESGDLSLTFTQNVDITSVGSTNTSVVSNITSEGITADTAEVISEISESLEESSSEYTITGGNHTHNALITLGEINNVISEEDTKTWENKAFKIEPNYYSLIFIMKL